MVRYLIPEAKGEDGKIYTPEQLNSIKQEDPNNEIFQQLHCKYCGVKLEFRRETQAKKAVISTWPKCRHKDSCPIASTAQLFRKGSSYGGNIEVELSSEDKRNKRDYLYTVLHSKQKINSRDLKPRTKREIITEGQGKPKGGIGTGTINPKKGENSVRNNRSPRINHMAAGHLDKSLIGKTVLFWGTLEQVKISGNSRSASIVLKHGNDRLDIHTSPNYFQTDKNLIKRFKSLKKKLGMLSEGPETYAFGAVQYKINSTEIEAVMYYENDMGFPKKTLSEYLGPI